MPQFPPGLETLRDVKDKAKIEVKKVKKLIDVSKTPNNIATSNGDLSGGANNEDKTMKKRTSQRIKQENPKSNETVSFQSVLFCSTYSFKGDTYFCPQFIGSETQGKKKRNSHAQNEQVHINLTII